MFACVCLCARVCVLFWPALCYFPLRLLVFRRMFWLENADTTAKITNVFKIWAQNKQIDFINCILASTV